MRFLGECLIVYYIRQPLWRRHTRINGDVLCEEDRTDLKLVTLVNIGNNTAVKMTYIAYHMYFNRNDRCRMESDNNLVPAAVPHITGIAIHVCWRGQHGSWWQTAVDSFDKVSKGIIMTLNMHSSWIKCLLNQMDGYWAEYTPSDISIINSKAYLSFDLHEKHFLGQTKKRNPPTFCEVAEITVDLNKACCWRGPSLAYIASSCTWSEMIPTSLQWHW